VDQNTLVSERIDAGQAFIAEFARKRPVKIAFWLKLSEESRWYLYVASEDIDGKTIRDAYKDVLIFIQGMKSPFLDPFEVKLIGADAALAQAAWEAQQRYPARMSALYRDCQLGDLSIEGAYFYPTPTAALVGQNSSTN
jgi:hypothetical protein